MQEYDIIVAGAGPGGSTFVRCLADTDLRIALIDKATFPRDKVCGDAIPGTAIRVGRRRSPAFWDGLPALNPLRRTRGFSPSGDVLDLEYVNDGYTCPRLAFDDYLLRQALEYPRLDTYFDSKLKDLAYAEGRNVVTLSDGAQLRAPLVVGADGAHSVVAKKRTATKLDRNHHCAAVRAYYRGLTDIKDDRMMFYFLDGFLPGYFWIFPLKDGLFNVGFGMLSRQISERRIDLRDSLDRIVAESPQVKRHFAAAERVGDNAGFGLPLGSRTVPRSGDGFLLVGDAAGLVDPFTGEGIGNAMMSAEMAAATARAAFASGKFDAGFLRSYDRAVSKKMGLDFKLKHYAQRVLADRPWLINGLMRLAANSRVAHWALKKVV